MQFLLGFSNFIETIINKLLNFLGIIEELILGVLANSSLVEELQIYFQTIAKRKRIALKKSFHYQNPCTVEDDI